MVEANAVLQVADGVPDFSVAAMVGLQVQGVALPVGDEGVIAVVGEQQSYARIRPVLGRTNLSVRPSGHGVTSLS